MGSGSNFFIFCRKIKGKIKLSYSLGLQQPLAVLLRKGTKQQTFFLLLFLLKIIIILVNEATCLEKCEEEREKGGR